MKKVIYLILIISSFSCGRKVFLNANRTRVFLLNDTYNSDYLVDSIKTAFQKGIFTKSPLVTIDGIVLKYDKTKDTLILSLKKSDITNVMYIGGKASSVIYNKKEIYGAIIINTTALNK
jgi:hypothetical protein